MKVNFCISDPPFLQSIALPKIPFWIFLIIAALYFSAVRVDIMDIDASQYAEMSREMMVSRDYLHLYDHGADYLDKPPFLFWISSLSMQLFGVNNLGYKLPSILFALLALYATYRLTRLLYDEATGRVAALVLGVCQGLFLMTNDVRTDTILMGWVVTALWCIKECEIRRRWQFVLGGCMAIACGLMTKGPIALFVPLFAFGTDWVLKRKWKNLFNPRHIIDLCIIAALLIPMSIGLYEQFDLHPEKVMDGKTGTSGLRFFFWSQSFGRITGESVWDNGADMSFLLLNMAWSFLPWILLFVTALFLQVKQLIQQRFRLTEQQEWISTGGFILTYLSLSLSHYQLPHYIFVAFPLAAIMVAGLLRQFWTSGSFARLHRVFSGIQIGLVTVLLIGVLLILLVVFPAGWIGIVSWLIMVAVLIVLLRQQLKGSILWLSAVAMILVNVFLTHHFYYQLLQYQAGSVVGKYLQQHKIGTDRFMSAAIKDPLSCLDFYAGQINARTDAMPDSLQPGQYVLTTDTGLVQLKQENRSYSILQQGRYFKVSELTPDFLNQKTRDKATTPYYILRVD